MINYNKKAFQPVSNTANAQTSAATIFHYQQQGNILSGTYSGGAIKAGQLLGVVNTDGTLYFFYHQLDEAMQLHSGYCKSVPEILADGRIRLHEEWQWTSGDNSNGKSIIEEIKQ
ncbi:MAG: n-acetylglutamate synthase [Sphingobacteriales bacterium]|jgi:hypothetical protein|nr:MAG: n-acetylglutamate synthase [Sphingobacteriales bacterium]